MSEALLNGYGFRDIAAQDEIPSLKKTMRVLLSTSHEVKKKKNHS